MQHALHRFIHGHNRFSAFRHLGMSQPGPIPDLELEGDEGVKILNVALNYPFQHIDEEVLDSPVSIEEVSYNDPDGDPDESWTDPLDFTDIEAWFDPTDAASVTQDMSDKVELWEAQGASGYELEQTDSAKRLSYGVISVGETGKAVLFNSADNADEWLQLASGSFSQPYTIAVLVEAYSAPAAARYVWGGNSGHPRFYTNPIGVNLGSALQLGTGQNNQFLGRHLWVVVGSGSNSRVYRDGVLWLSGNAGTTAISVFMLLNSLQGATFGMHCSIGDLVIVGGKPPLAELNAFGMWMSDRWALPAGWHRIHSDTY